MARTEGSLHQGLGANAAATVLALVLPLAPEERATNLMGGTRVLALGCRETAVERIVSDESEALRPRARQAKEAGRADVALAGLSVGIIRAGVAWRLAWG